MQVLVTYASCRESAKKPGTFYPNVEYVQLAGVDKQKRDEAGWKTLAIRAEASVAMQLMEVLKTTGPVVCDVDLQPLIFGQNKDLMIVAARPLATADKVIITAQGFTARK